jgi:hypothetical protein
VYLSAAYLATFLSTPAHAADIISMVDGDVDLRFINVPPQREDMGGGVVGYIHCKNRVLSCVTVNCGEEQVVMFWDLSRRSAASGFQVVWEPLARKVQFKSFPWGASTEKLALSAVSSSQQESMAGEMGLVRVKHDGFGPPPSKFVQKLKVFTCWKRWKRMAWTATV